ncbi:MAG: alpha/beta hydrolase [Actinomycetota bacterium]|nr:alpha/beta fold hydrolase [Actinomycetota bacterium]
MAIRSVRFLSGDLSLEGRIAEPDGPPLGSVVLCHPHPLYGGSMSSALLPALQRRLCAAGITTLRFNFRGAGRSDGRYDDGRGEVNDALAALDQPTATPLVIAGWSFGAVVAMHAALRSARISAVAGMAMPLATVQNIRSPEAPSPSEMRRWGKPLLMITGERDVIAPPEPAEAWAAEAGGASVRIKGADHLFTGFSEDVGTALLQFLIERVVE